MSTVHKQCQLCFLCDGGWATKERTCKVSGRRTWRRWRGERICKPPRYWEAQQCWTGKTNSAPAAYAQSIGDIFGASSPSRRPAFWANLQHSSQTTHGSRYPMVSNDQLWNDRQLTVPNIYIYIYNFPEYKTTPQAFGSVASHPILTVAARYTDLHNTLIYIDLYRFTLIYTACFVVVQRLSDSRIFKPFGQLVGFVHGCSWGLGRVELGPTVAKSGSSISCTCSKRSWEPVPWQIRKVDTLGYSRIKLMNLHDYYGRVRRESEVLNHLKNELTKHET